MLPMLFFGNGEDWHIIYVNANKFNSRNRSAIYLANVLDAFSRPKGITVYSYLPDGVKKAVLYWSSGFIGIW